MAHAPREIILAKNLGFQYVGAPRAAIQGIDLSIKENEFILLTGPSGCGKTSLCRCLNGLIPNFYQGEWTGELLVDNLSVTTQLTSELSRRVGYVFQNPENQLFALTVEKDIAFGPENLGLSREQIRQRVDEAMNVTGTLPLKDLAPYELSGGQQQRVALAGVLAMKPSVIVLDEPTSFLDPRTAEDVMRATDDGNLEETLDEKFDLLEGLGVGVPRVSLLWTMLRRDGLVSGKVPTHVESAALSLGGMMNQ